MVRIAVMVGVVALGVSAFVGGWHVAQSLVSAQIAREAEYADRYENYVSFSKYLKTNTLGKIVGVVASVDNTNQILTIEAPDKYQSSQNASYAFSFDPRTVRYDTSIPLESYIGRPVIAPVTYDEDGRLSTVSMVLWKQ